MSGKTSRRKAIRAFLIICTTFLLFSCSSKAGDDESSGGKSGSAYQKISAAKAQEMMDDDQDVIIVDVRSKNEYAEAHIPGAICIPNESIKKARLSELPDLDQTILVYCRTGRRSKQAAHKLLKIGYVNVYDFGGINEWTGDTISER